MKKAQRGLSLDLDADWASEAHSLIQSWQAAETKQAGGSGSSNPDDKQTGSSKPHTQGRQGQQKQQQQTKKQPKKYKQQSQQQQQQAKHQQPEQPEQRQEQEQPSTSRPQENFKAAGGSPDASYGPGSAPHGQYSYVYGPQGQRTQSAAPGTSDLSAAHHEWLSAGMLPRAMAYDGQNEFRNDGDMHLSCAYMGSKTLNTSKLAQSIDSKVQKSPACHVFKTPLLGLRACSSPKTWVLLHFVSSIRLLWRNTQLVMRMSRLALPPEGIVSQLFSYSSGMSLWRWLPISPLS